MTPFRTLRFLVALVMVTAVLSAPCRAGERPALLRIDLAGPATELDLPIHALYRDAAGAEYALVIAPPSRAVGTAHVVLDPDAAVSPGWIVALERRPGARRAAAARLPVLMDDGRRIVLRDGPGLRDVLGTMGFDLSLLPAEPLVLTRPRPPALPTVSYDQRVADMMAQVLQGTVFNYNGGLSGETPVTIGGDSYTIPTRHTASGVPIQKATQYVSEFMQDLGLAVSFHQWNASSYSGRNVIGEKPGATNPDEIVLITCHLDDMPPGDLAPGADDNGSGSTAVMLAAEIMGQQWFERTLRFVFFTGEEQGLLGSSAYAQKVAADGETVVAVFNMDMIAYDAVGGPTLRLHTRTTGHPGHGDDLAIATVFSDVVSTYGLSGALTPIVDPDGITASDHASFWNRGYPGILAIEDDVDDFNAHYHTVNDTRANLNMTYFTNFVKASIGTAAHLAIPTTAPCQQGMSFVELAVDGAAAPTSLSNTNGVLEPGERVVLAPTWRYPGGCSPRTVSGEVTEITGPAGFTFSRPHPGASYGLMMPGEVTNCWDEGENCYVIGAFLGSRPATHLDITVTEELSANVTALWTVHVGASFADVPVDHQTYRHVEAMLHNGITSGCGGGNFCPDGTVTRWQMAVFLSAALADRNVPVSGTVDGMGDFDCSPGGRSVFGDVSPTDPACRFVHYLATSGITRGCGGGLYCPSDQVDRWQMAVFLSKSISNLDEIPFSGTIPGRGDFDCSPGGNSLFDDVPPEDPGCRFVHHMAAKGITAGCTPTSYCPHANLSRAQMAVFLTKAFHLGLAEGSTP